MNYWQSNENWQNAKTVEDLHTCGTTYCIRGYAEAQYFVETGKICEDPDSLYPELRHLFYMSTKQAKEKIFEILNS